MQRAGCKVQGKQKQKRGHKAHPPSLLAASRQDGETRGVGEKHKERGTSYIEPLFYAEKLLEMINKPDVVALALGFHFSSLFEI